MKSDDSRVGEVWDLEFKSGHFATQQHVLLVVVDEGVNLRVVDLTDESLRATIWVATTLEEHESDVMHLRRIA